MTLQRGKNSNVWGWMRECRRGGGDVMWPGLALISILPSGRKAIPPPLVLVPALIPALLVTPPPAAAAEEEEEEEEEDEAVVLVTCLARAEVACDNNPLREPLLPPLLPPPSDPPPSDPPPSDPRLLAREPLLPLPAREPLLPLLAALGFVSLIWHCRCRGRGNIDVDGGVSVM